MKTDPGAVGPVRLTAMDRRVLAGLTNEPASPGRVAQEVGISTMSPRETAARHLIRLTKAGLAHKSGTRMFPMWSVSSAGRAALTQPVEADTGERGS